MRLRASTQQKIEHSRSLSPFERIHGRIDVRLYTSAQHEYSLARAMLWKINYISTYSNYNILISMLQYINMDSDDTFGYNDCASEIDVS